ncbi:hypothetical protein [Sporichthya sp.]|uniref:hypothetical protein n=1 Tax=Sporichthya sp. TaxID=65475 RepID=UPI00179E417D|nr:hypothetical protein [Sporichthya sp.]MBA3742324.1 hypothetical protein [Sporichthya sp.]
MDASTRINELLDSTDTESVGTSMRIPTALRDAAAIAVSELGAASSTTTLTTDALRARLEAIVMQAALDAHYAAHPAVRPSLAELALAAAELDGHPLAARPDLIEEAATAILEWRPHADADEVLLWAEARSAGAA